VAGLLPPGAWAPCRAGIGPYGTLPSPGRTPGPDPAQAP
jgi:hypothetical protein